MRTTFTTPLSLALAALLLLSNLAFATDKYSARLDTVLAAQADDAKARYSQRHPKETLTFFDIKPGMTVIEALPGGGWYSKILLPYLGENGQLIGVDYAHDMWPKFSWASEEFINTRKTWSKDWPETTTEWKIQSPANISAYTFKTLPDTLSNTVDAALFIRALHNLHRFEKDGAYFTTALKNTLKALKPGGILGVVQHQSKHKNLDGSTGYLEKETLIAKIESLGYQYIGESDINKNPKDKPTADDIVWRLPPSFYTSGDNAELRKQYANVGESNRMTLKFIKPIAKKK